MDYEIKLTNDFSMYKDDIGKLINVNMFSYQYNSTKKLDYCLVLDVVCDHNNLYEKDVFLLLPSKEIKNLKLNIDIKSHEIKIKYLS